MIYRNITQLIGKTPLVALENIQKELRLKARLLAKSNISIRPAA